MFASTKAFSGYAVDDIPAAERFYGEILGIRTSTEMDGYLLNLELADGERPTMIYAKPDFEPATYTVLNFPVDDVEAAVDALTAKGVAFEHYEGSGQDAKGISRGNGPTIAWFKDPAGNILSVLENPMTP
ncbi:MAG: VOC family protein [Solirubrobacteraceae bacterium]|nr:VOC family protein [Solirubrobacteraceae bacterium]